MSNVRRLSFTLFADYCQFYLQDESVEGITGDSWTKEAIDRYLALGPGTIGIRTVRDMHIPVVVEFLEQKPESDSACWDHVVECHLDVPTGRIVIAGCTDDFREAARLDVVPGVYRVRASFGALDSLSEDEREGSDHYRIQLWPGLEMEPKIVKQRVVS